MRLLRQHHLNIKSGFLGFVFYEKQNRMFLIIMPVIQLILFAIFKLAYPFPDFFADSYSYIFAAFAHLDINIWPIGYSKFLSLFHEVTASAYMLVLYQFILLSIASMYFYFTLLYHFTFSAIVHRVICITLFLNPILFYLCNYVSSDSLFLALSIIWLTELIWISRSPRIINLVTLTIVSTIAFTIRNNAMYYPLVAAVVILMSKQRWAYRAVGIIASPILIFIFIHFSREAARQMTGTAQFPLLAGWQWGNNALYMREFIEVDSSDLPNAQTKELDRIAAYYFQHEPPEKRNLPAYVANFFIRKESAPLKQYLRRHYDLSTAYSSVVAWGMASPVFGDYGKTLIKQHPIEFFQHYILVNTKNYFYPPLEVLHIYNLGRPDLYQVGVDWFRFNTKKATVINPYLQGVLLLIYPLLFLLLNAFYFGMIAYVLMRKKFTQIPVIHRMVLLFILLNMGFSIFANIIVIRYQIFPMTVFLLFSPLLWEYAKSISTETEEKPRKISIVDATVHIKTQQ